MFFDGPVGAIEKLLKNGNAYESDGHILFDVKSYKNYGKLSNRELDQMISGARVEIAKYKYAGVQSFLIESASFIIY